MTEPAGGSRHRFRISLAVYRLFLLLYPPSFRARFGPSMEQDFVDGLAGTAEAGQVRGRLVTWSRFLADLMIAVPRQWFRRTVTHGGARGRAGRLASWLERHAVELAGDVRVGVRVLGKARAFTSIAVLSLGLGLGINSALLSVIDALWLKPVPGVVDQDRVVELLLRIGGREVQEWSYPDFVAVRSAGTPIRMLAGWKRGEGVLGGAGVGRPVRLMYVTASYFDVLGVTGVRGTTFAPAVDRGTGERRLVVISDRVWRNEFASDPDVIGRSIDLNRVPHTVVGIAPAGFSGHQPLDTPIDAWIPLGQHRFMVGVDALAEDRAALWLQVLGRLAPGATVTQANSALRTVFDRLEAEYPETNERRSAEAARFGRFPALNRTADMLAIGAMLAASLIVLLIICGNVAGMALARAVTREREMAVRIALGAGRARVVRQLLVEAALLAGAGALAGLLLARLGLDLVGSRVGNGMTDPLDLDASVLVLSFLLAGGATLAFGLLPALRFSRPGSVRSLRHGTAGSGRVSRVHRLAASAQAGVALLLLVIGGLFVRSLDRWDAVDPGFVAPDLFMARVDTEGDRQLSMQAGLLALERLRTSLEAVPGVVSVAAGDGLPLDGVGNFTTVVDQQQPDRERTVVEFTRVDEAYFETIGATLRAGRGFVRSDDVSAELGVVVTRSLADRLWPGANALGRELRLPLSLDEARTYRVVGVLDDVSSSRATENHPQVFVALRQNFTPRLMLLVRARPGTTDFVDAMRAAILSADPGQASPDVVTAHAMLARATTPQRQMARVATGLGLLALMLSALGLYGVIAFTVTSRTRELGVRMAVGASPASIRRGVVRDTVWLAVPGLAGGAVLAVGLAASFRSMLLFVSPLDPVTFGVAAALLLVVALAAGLLPARRASRIEPMAGLRLD